MKNDSIVPPINHPITYCIIGCIIIALALMYVITILFLTRKPKPKPPQTRTIPKLTTAQLKQKYLTQINNVNRLFIRNQITNIQAHQQLSVILRWFIFEVSGTPFQIMTLSEIAASKKNFTVSQIINTYYPSEFDGKNSGDVEQSAELARKFIQSWT